VNREAMNPEKIHGAEKLRKCSPLQKNVSIQPNPEINNQKFNTSQNRFLHFGQASADAVSFYSYLELEDQSFY